MTESTEWDAWRGRLTASKRRRDDNIGDWQINVDKRKGNASRNTASDNPSPRAVSASVSVNKDWPLTKAKIALLYSQTPEIRLSTDNPQASQAVSAFARSLNKTIGTAQVGAAIEEVLADVINAAGVGGVLIACEKRTETRDVPKFDPVVAGMSGGENPMVPTVTVTDIRYPVQRISPASLLIPSDFTGSVYDQARWLGYEGALAVGGGEAGIWAEGRGQGSDLREGQAHQRDHDAEHRRRSSSRIPTS
jgi:hypothetical protein